jgi:nucleotide-binding universal stress UspA family protein
MKILIAVDGSEYSRRAANYVAQHASQLAQAPEIHLLHVHAPLPYPGAAAALGKGAIENYQRDESEAALSVAEKELASLKPRVKSAWCAGEIANEVARYVEANGIDLVVVGSHGHGSFASFALGSVAVKIVATIKTPVLIVR